MTPRLALAACLLAVPALAQTQPSQQVFGFRDFAAQAKVDAQFQAIPDPILAGQHLKELTKAPHWASSPEDYATAEYVAARVQSSRPPNRNCPLPRPAQQARFHPHRSLRPRRHSKLMSGPTPEHVGPRNTAATPSRTTPASSPPSTAARPPATSPPRSSTPTTAPPPTSSVSAALGIDPSKAKSSSSATAKTTAASRPTTPSSPGPPASSSTPTPPTTATSAATCTPKAPTAPTPPSSAAAVQFLPIYPGDPTTPGVSSTLDLPDSKRIPQDKLQANWPSIPVNPLSYKDAAPILAALAGPAVPTRVAGRVSPSPITSAGGDSHQRRKSPST